MQLRQKDIDRFHAGYERRGEDECWLWKMSVNHNGYGRMKTSAGTKRANRISFFVHNGYLPDDKMVCHSCDTPACVNPKHLWLGTGKENQQDCIRKGRKHTTDQRGEKNHAAILDNAKAKQIIELIAEGMSNKEIAAIFGVTHSAVSLIRLGKSWRHLPRPSDDRASRFQHYASTKSRPTENTTSH